MANDLPRALFVCVHNAGRSQMAAAFWSALGGEARSAGSAPARRVHPEVVEALGEVGIDVAGRLPHLLDRSDVEWADVVVTMGCGDACPLIPGKRYVNWELDDPAGQSLEAVRRVRDVVRERIRRLALAEASDPATD